jgi:hypothetical protein
VAAFRIPVRAGVPNQRMRVRLDGRDFLLDLLWSTSEARWYLDLLDVQGAPVVLAVPVILAHPLLARYRPASALPPGELVVVDARQGASGAPGLEDLGDVAQLLYLDAAELAEASS